MRSLDEMEMGRKRFELCMTDHRCMYVDVFRVIGRRFFEAGTLRYRSASGNGMFGLISR